MRKLLAPLCAFILAWPLVGLAGPIPGGGGAAGAESDPVYAGQKGAANGAATLDGASKLTASQLPAITSSTLTFGTWVGGSTTFAGLPAAGAVAKDGDWAVLHVDDGANPAGLYELASSVWTLRVAITEGDVDAGANVPGSCGSRDLFVENDVAPPVLYACTTGGTFSQVGGGGSGSNVSIGGAFLGAVDLRSEGTVDLTICTSAGVPDARCPASADVLFDPDGWDAFVDLASATPCQDFTDALEDYNEGTDRDPYIFVYQSAPMVTLDQGDFLATATSGGAGSFLACAQMMPTAAHAGGVPVADGTKFAADFNTHEEGSGRIHWHNVDVTIDCDDVAQTSDLVFLMKGGGYLNGRSAGTGMYAGGTDYNAPDETGSRTVRLEGDCDGGRARGVPPFMDPTGANLLTGTSTVVEFTNGAYRSDTSKLIRRYFYGALGTPFAATTDYDDVGIIHQWTWGMKYGSPLIRGLGGLGMLVLGSSDSVLTDPYFTHNQGVGLFLGDPRGGAKLYATQNCHVGADCGQSAGNYEATSFRVRGGIIEGNLGGNVLATSAKNVTLGGGLRLETAPTLYAHSFAWGVGYCVGGSRDGMVATTAADCYGGGTLTAPTAIGGQAFGSLLTMGLSGVEMVGTSAASCTGSCVAPFMDNPDLFVGGPYAASGNQFAQDVVLSDVFLGSHGETYATRYDGACNALAPDLRVSNLSVSDGTRKLGWCAGNVISSDLVTHPTSCPDIRTTAVAGTEHRGLLPGSMCVDLDDGKVWTVRSDDGDFADAASDWARAQAKEPVRFGVQDASTYAGGICFYQPEAFTITEVRGYVGSAGTGPTTQVEIRTDPSAAPTNVLAAPLALDTNGETTTTIQNASVAAGEYVCWPALGGTPAVDRAVVEILGVL